MFRKKSLLVVLAMVMVAGLVLMACAPVVEEPYPHARTIVVLSGGSIGGVQDTLSRGFASFGPDHTEGATFRMIHMPGAGHTVALKHLLDQPAADYGYTILFTSIHPLVVALKEPKPIIDLETDIRVVGIHTFSEAYGVVRDDAPWATWEELIAYIREHPGEFVLGGTEGFVLQLAMLFYEEGVWDNMTCVTYDTGAEGVTDVIGGHIDMAAPTSAVAYGALPHIRPLIQTGMKPGPIEEFKDVPTAPMLGLPVTAAPMWLFVHPDTPDDRMEYFVKLYTDIFSNEDYLKVLSRRGIEGDVLMTYPETQEFYREVVDRQRAGLIALGLRPEEW